MYLPDPAVFLTASIACVLGGGAIFWFLKTPKLALDALVLAAVCGLCYVVSAGYEAKEEAKIQPKLDAANAQLAALAKEAQQFQDAAAAAEAKAEAADAKAKSLAAQLHKSLLEAIHAQPAQVLTVLVPAPLVQLLDSAIDTTNAGRPSAVSGTVDAGATLPRLVHPMPATGQPGAPTSSPSTTTAPSTLTPSSPATQPSPQPTLSLWGRAKGLVGGWFGIK